MTDTVSVERMPSRSETQADDQARCGILQRDARADPGGGRSHDGEAQAAAVRAVGVAEPHEAVEHAVAVGGGDAGAVVAHRQFQGIIRRTDRDRHRAAGTIVADAVVDEVAEDLDQQGAVARHRHRHVGGIQLQFHARLDRLTDAAADDAHRDFAQVDAFQRRRDAGFLGTGQREQLHQQPFEPGDRGGDFVQRTVAVIRRAAAGECDLHFQDRQRRAHLVRGVGGEAARRRRRGVELRQHPVERLGKRAQFERQGACVDRRQVGGGGAVARLHRAAQPGERAQAPSQGRAQQQDGDADQRDLAAEQRDQQAAGQRGASVERLGDLDDDRTLDRGQRAPHLGDADALVAIGGEAEARLVDREVVRGRRGQIGIAGQQVAADRDAVIDVVALAVLQHPERGGRQVERHLAALHLHGFRDGAQRAAEHAVVGAADDIGDQCGARDAEQHRDPEQRPEHRHQQPRPQRDRARGGRPARHPVSSR